MVVEDWAGNKRTILSKEPRVEALQGWRIALRLLVLRDWLVILKPCRHLLDLLEKRTLEPHWRLPLEYLNSLSLVSRSFVHKLEEPGETLTSPLYTHK